MPDDVDVTIGGDVDSGVDPSLSPTPDTGRTPAADEGEGSGDLDLEQIAEEFDAEALAELGGRPRPVRGEGVDADGKRTTSSDPIDDFIEKNYQGDRGAFVHSLYSSREEMKRMRSELDELKRGEPTSHARVPIEPRDVEADFKSARSSNPELNALDQEIRVIDDDAKLATQELQGAAGRAQQVASRVKELQGQMSKSEPEERATIRAEIAELNAELFSLDQGWKATQSEIRRLNMEKRRVQREVIRAEQSIRESMTDEENAVRERSEIVATTRQQFDSSLAAHFASIGVDPKSEQGQFLRETCRTKLRDHFESQGDGYGLDGAGIHSAVGQILARAVKVFNIRPSSSPRKSTTPRPIVTPRTPAPFIRTGPRTSSPQSSLDGVLDNPNLSPREKAAFVQKRAAAVFSAGSRAAARGGSGPS